MSHSFFPIEKPVIALVGPTAIGKTELSLLLSERFNCEIVSLDSMQIYRYMDIGTAKASIQERQLVPHHLIDIVNPDESYDVDRYIHDSLHAIHSIHIRNKVPLLTGGTGLYLKALTQGIFENVGNFPEIRQHLQKRLEKEGRSKLHEELDVYDCITAKRVHVNDTQRLLRALEIYHGTGVAWSEHIESQRNFSKEKRFNSLLQIGLKSDREKLYERINLRASLMIQEGLQEEVENLLAMGYSHNLNSMQSIGYRHMLQYLNDNWDLDETVRYLARDTRHYAKRQFTWFKKMNIEWFEVTNQSGIVQRISHFLKQV